MKPFNFNEGSREQTRCEAVARARFHRWQAPGRSRVVHPAHGSIVVPHTSNLAAILNAAEVWRCDWATILDAEVWAADPAALWPKCLYILNKGGQAGDHRGKGPGKGHKSSIPT